MQKWYGWVNCTLTSDMQDSAELGLAARLFFGVDMDGVTMHLQASFTLDAVNSKKGVVVRVLLHISNMFKLSCACSTDSEIHHVQKYSGSLAVRWTTAMSPATQFGVAA
jgi:hypothetical protein